MVGVVQKQSRDQEADKLALADFLIVNVVTGAPDGHAKNVSMLRLADGAWIAPLYDLATGLVYDGGAVDRTVALSIGGERQASRIRRRQWERAAATLGLPVDRVLGRVVQLAGAYPDALTEALDELGDADGAADVGERALSGARTHCTRLVDQLA